MRHACDKKIFPDLVLRFSLNPTRGLSGLRFDRHGITSCGVALQLAGKEPPGGLELFISSPRSQQMQAEGHPKPETPSMVILPCCGDHTFARETPSQNSHYTTAFPLLDYFRTVGLEQQCG